MDERMLKAMVAAGAITSDAFSPVRWLLRPEVQKLRASRKRKPAAAGLPVYAFFGPTDWRRSHALGQQDRVLTNPVPCSPCHLPVCPPEKRHTCLDGITPAAVLARMESDGVL
mgnify:CR=1 FL=1